jgi:hypothetical protein
MELSCGGESDAIGSRDGSLVGGNGLRVVISSFRVRTVPSFLFILPSRRGPMRNVKSSKVIIDICAFSSFVGGVEVLCTWEVRFELASSESSSGSLEFNAEGPAPAWRRLHIAQIRTRHWKSHRVSTHHLSRRFEVLVCRPTLLHHLE